MKSESLINGQQRIIIGQIIWMESNVDLLPVMNAMLRWLDADEWVAVFSEWILQNMEAEFTEYIAELDA